MNQSNTKARSKAWIWILVILLVILACCCVTATGAFFYLRSQETTLREIITEELEIPSDIPIPDIVTQQVQPAPQIEPEPEKETPEQTPLLPPAGKLVLSTDQGIWLMDESTRETTQASNMPLEAPTDLREGMSPDHRQFAYFSGFGGASINPWLVVVDLESQTAVVETELTGPLSQPAVDFSVGDPGFEAARAMQYANSLAWSPDGTRLAFVGAMDGDSADVYLFNRSDLSITRLTDETGHAAALHWSPDGRYLQYFTVESFGTGAGLSMLGLWAYDFQGRQPRLLEDLVSGGEIFRIWTDPSTFLIYSWDAMCEGYNLREVDASGGGQKVIVNACFSGAAYNPLSVKGLIAVTEFNQENCDCGESLEAGTYIFGEGFPVKKFEYILAYSVEFIPREQLFALYTDQGLQYLYQDGVSIPIPTEVLGLKPYPSPDGGYWAWASYYSGKTGLWIAQPAGTPVEISPLFSGTPVWGQGGQTLYYAEDGLLFSADAPGFQGEILQQIPGVDILDVVR